MLLLIHNGSTKEDNMAQATITLTMDHGTALALRNLLAREQQRINSLKRPRRSYFADNICRAEFVRAYDAADA